MKRTRPFQPVCFESRDLGHARQRMTRIRRFWVIVCAIAFAAWLVWVVGK